MKTQPPVMYQAGTFSFPLPPNLWQFFCDKPDAEVVLAAVKRVVADATLVDGTADLFMPAMSLSDPIKIWEIRGTYGGANVAEWAGALFDRMKDPNGWVDKNPDSTVGGDQIHVTTYGQYAELSWRKVASPSQ